MLLYSTLATASLACINTSNQQIVDNVGHVQSLTGLDLGHGRLEEALYRSASDASLVSRRNFTVVVRELPIFGSM